MYIQLTERCNMRCEHCGFGCTAKGRDMDMDIFSRAWDLAREYGDCVTLGGGEPTLWKHFGAMVDWMRTEIWNSHVENITMITNGSRVRNTFKFLNLKDELDENGWNEDMIQITLSHGDGYHDDTKVHPKVLEEFCRRANQSKYGQYIWFRNNVNRVVKAGRAKEWGDVDDCICDDWFVKPDGKIYVCGCEDSPVIGDVWSGLDVDDDVLMERECWKVLKENEKELIESAKEEEAA